MSIFTKKQNFGPDDRFLLPIIWSNFLEIKVDQMIGTLLMLTGNLAIQSPFDICESKIPKNIKKWTQRSLYDAILGHNKSLLAQ